MFSLNRSLSSFSSLMGSEETNKDTVRNIQDLLHLLNEKGAEMSADSEALLHFESAVATILLRNPDPDLAKVLEDCGWTGCRFRDSDEAPLDVEYCKQALCNFYLKVSNVRTKSISGLSFKRSVSNTALDSKPNQIAEQLFSLCPDLLVDALELDPSPEHEKTPFCVHFWGACVLADMSGFSKFSGEMCSKGVEGLDELRATTSGFLGDLVNTVYKYKGDVIAFAGDALICVFPGCKPYLGSQPLMEPKDFSAECCVRALLCACELSAKTTQHSNHKQSGVTHNLFTHVGVSYGEMSLSILGGLGGQWVYVLSGSCVNDLATCVPDAGPQEVACTRLCLRKVEPFDNDKLLFKSKLFTGNGNVKIKVQAIESSEAERVRAIEELVSTGSFTLKSFFVKNVGYRRRGLERVQTSKPLMKALSRFVPSTVRHALQSEATDILGELRSVTTMFLSLDSYCKDKEGKEPLKLQPFLTIAQRRLDESGGFLRQFLVDDKGCVLIAMWGVPAFSYANNGARGLICAASIFLDAKHAGFSVSIGVATGMVFCGCVGAKNRFDYVGIGTDVNIAARLMSKANGKVLIDPATYKSLNKSARACLVSHDVLHLKGLKEPMQPYRFNNDGSNPLPSLTEPDERLCSNLMLRRPVVEALSHQLDRVSQALREKGIFSEYDSSDKEDFVGIVPESVSRQPSRQASSCAQRHPSVMFLLGPAGAGKSAACKYFRQAAHQRNISCIIIQAHSAHRNVPYGVARDLFFALVGRQSYATGQFGRSLLQLIVENAFTSADDGLAEGETIETCCIRLENVLGLQWVEVNEEAEPLKSLRAKLSREMLLIDDDEHIEKREAEILGQLHSSSRREKIDFPGMNERVDTLSCVENRIYSSLSNDDSPWNNGKSPFSPLTPRAQHQRNAQKGMDFTLNDVFSPPELIAFHKESVSDTTAETITREHSDGSEIDIVTSNNTTANAKVDSSPLQSSFNPVHSHTSPKFSAPGSYYMAFPSNSNPQASNLSKSHTKGHNKEVFRSESFSEIAPETRVLKRQASINKSGGSFFDPNSESSKRYPSQHQSTTSSSVNPLATSPKKLKQTSSSQYRLRAMASLSDGDKQMEELDDLAHADSKYWQDVTNNAQWASDRSQKHGMAGFKRRAPTMTPSELSLSLTSPNTKLEVEEEKKPNSPRSLDPTTVSLTRNGNALQRIDDRHREEAIFYVVLRFLLKDSPKAIVIENGHYCDERSWQLLERLIEESDVNFALLVTIVLRNHLSETDKEDYHALNSASEACVVSFQTPRENMHTGSDSEKETIPPVENALDLPSMNSSTPLKTQGPKAGRPSFTGTLGGQVTSTATKFRNRSGSEDLQVASTQKTPGGNNVSLYNGAAPRFGVANGSTNAFRFSARGLAPSNSTNSTHSNVYMSPSSDGINTRNPIMKAKLVEKLKNDVVGAGLAVLNKPYSDVVELGALSREEVREILKHSLKVDTVSDELADLVVNVSSGNPFWCRTIATFIKEQGLQEFTQRSLSANPTSTLEFLIVCRMDKLEERDRIILRHASIIGLVFTKKMLQAILPFRAEKGMLLSILGSFVGQGFLLCLEEFPEHKFAFQNPLIQSVIYGVNTPSDAASIHRSIAEFLEVTYNENLRPHYSSLAFHYGQCADQKELAFKYQIKSADQSIGQGAFNDGLELLKKSFEYATHRAELELILDLIAIAKEDIESTLRTHAFRPVLNQVMVLKDRSIREYEKLRKIVAERLRSWEIEREPAAYVGDDSIPDEREAPNDRRKQLAWQPSYFKHKRTQVETDPVNNMTPRGIHRVLDHFKPSPSKERRPSHQPKNVILEEIPSDGVPVVELTDDCYPCLIS